MIYGTEPHSNGLLNTSVSLRPRLEVLISTTRGGNTMSSGQRLKGLHYTKNNLDLLGLSPSGTLADFMCAAWHRAALQWAPQFFREPTRTTRDSYFIDRCISLSGMRPPYFSCVHSFVPSFVLSFVCIQIRQCEYSY